MPWSEMGTKPTPQVRSKKLKQVLKKPRVSPEVRTRRVSPKLLKDEPEPIKTGRAKQTNIFLLDIEVSPKADLQAVAPHHKCSVLSCCLSQKPLEVPWIYPAQVKQCYPADPLPVSGTPRPTQQLLTLYFLLYHSSMISSGKCSVEDLLTPLFLLSCEYPKAPVSLFPRWEMGKT